jgi:hypothetical protein
MMRLPKIARSLLLEEVSPADPSLILLSVVLTALNKKHTRLAVGYNNQTSR